MGFVTPYLQLTYTVLNSKEGLTPGVAYQFRYRAKNKYGWGPFSDSFSYNAAAIPLKSLPVHTSIENLYVKIAWTPSDD